MILYSGLLLMTVVIVTTGVVCYRLLSHAEPKKYSAVNKKWVYYPTLIGFGFFTFYCLFNSFTFVPSGHEGVRVVFGKVLPHSFKEGFQFKWPWEAVVPQEIRLNIHELDYTCLTHDQQKLTVHMKINWLRRARATPSLFEKVGIYNETVIERIIVPAAQGILKAEIAEWKVSDILLKRQNIKDKVQDALAIWIEKYDLELKEVSLSNFDFSTAYEQAIEEKQKKEQFAQQAEYERQREKTDADRAIAEAKGVADAMIEQAQQRAVGIIQRGESQAAVILAKARATAYMYEKVAETYTPELLQLELIQKWDKRMPIFLNGTGDTGGLQMLLNSSSLPSK